MQKTSTTNLVTASAVVLGLCGIGLIFAPGEIAPLLGVGPGGVLAVSLLGSALFGFGVMNWTARGSLLGGIYGRAVVAGNQAHFLVGALILLKLASGTEMTWPIIALLAVYLTHAALFSYLMFWKSAV